MARKSQQISEGIRAKLKKVRIARLATLDAQGRPHIVPVCFVYDGSVFYTAVDRKPKRVSPRSSPGCGTSPQHRRSLSLSMSILKTGRGSGSSWYADRQT